MNGDLSVLLLTAVSLGVAHTLLGPDHYLPFIFMSRAQHWSRRRTLILTCLCGLGHVLGSVVLGAAGIALGVVLSRLEFIEAARDQVAAWLMIGFGIAYTAWGLRRGYRHRPHTHIHAHPGGVIHQHEHLHEEEHVHVHASKLTNRHEGKDTAPATTASITPWILFTIFVFGPCEALIPLLMYPMAKESLSGAALVTAAFAVATIGTMCVVVLAGQEGFGRLRLAGWERYSHALAGMAIACCGMTMQFLGL